MTILDLAADPDVLVEALDEAREKASHRGDWQLASDCSDMCRRLGMDVAAYSEAWTAAMRMLATCDQCGEVSNDVTTDEDRVRLCPACKASLEEEESNVDGD